MQKTEPETMGEDLKATARRDFINLVNQRFATFLCPIHNKPSTLIEVEAEGKTELDVVSCCDEHTQNTIEKFADTPGKLL